MSPKLLASLSVSLLLLLLSVSKQGEGIRYMYLQTSSGKLHKKNARDMLRKIQYHLCVYSFLDLKSNPIGNICGGLVCGVRHVLGNIGLSVERKYAGAH